MNIGNGLLDVGVDGLEGGLADGAGGGGSCPSGAGGSGGAGELKTAWCQG